MVRRKKYLSLMLVGFRVMIGSVADRSTQRVGEGLWARRLPPEVQPIGWRSLSFSHFY